MMDTTIIILPNVPNRSLVTKRGIAVLMNGAIISDWMAVLVERPTPIAVMKAIE